MIKIDDLLKKKLEDRVRLDDLFSKGIEEQLNKFIGIHTKAIDYVLEYMLRHQVTPPIKGEITRGKAKWRGLLVAVSKENLFLGLTQRGKYIAPDWPLIRLNLDKECAMLFGSHLEHMKNYQQKYFTGGILTQKQ